MKDSCQFGRRHVSRAQGCLRPVARARQARCRCCRSEARGTKPLTNDFSKTVKHPLGRLQIRLLEEDDVKSVAVLISRSFASKEWQSLDNVMEYLEDAVKEPERTAVLVACLWPNEAAVDVVLPVAKDYRVVGVANLALTPESVNEYVSTESLEVPEACAYLSNMAVDKTLRRKKFGAAMMQACIELITSYTELEHICLHVKIDNDGAISMYEDAGFQIVGTDSFLAMFGGGREHLMQYTV